MAEQTDFIPVCEPLLNGNELKYVTEAIMTGWISSSGRYVRELEERFAQYCGVRFGVGACNGTAALHLATVSLGLGPGDEVIIPDFTMVSTAFAVCYTKATPVFVDVEADTWNIDPGKIEEKITARTKAIIAVSIFGHPCDMDPIKAIAEKHGLIVIEDAAESHGAEYHGIRTGGLARITAFSFYANKNLTMGEGGMVVTDDEDLYRKCLYYRNVCFSLDEPRNYRHDHIGFNYRLSNLHAAVGLAQLEKADEYCALRIRNNGLYRKYVGDIGGITVQGTRDNVLHVPWMNGILVDPMTYGRSRDELMACLAENNIETRQFFLGMHEQPSLLKYGCDGNGRYPVSDILAQNGMYLPSSCSLTENQVRQICAVIRDFKR